MSGAPINFALGGYVGTGEYSLVYILCPFVSCGSIAQAGQTKTQPPLMSRAHANTTIPNNLPRV